MNENIELCRQKINTLINELNKNEQIKTKDVRNISSTIYKMIKKESFDDILIFCETLLKEGDWARGVIAYDIAFREKRNYNSKTFRIFERWLKTYVRGWGDCDDFCTHAFGELVYQNRKLFKHIIKWCDMPQFWMKRAASVVLIYSIKKGQADHIKPFDIVDKLIESEDHLVIKGYGWMLKEYSVVNQSAVIEYITNNRARLPRTAYRYAIEKMDPETKKRLMAL